MEITHSNFMGLLSSSVDEMAVIAHNLQQIQHANINNHHYLEDLSQRFSEASFHLSAIMEFVVTHRPDPTIVGTKLKDSMDLMSLIYQEKTRIHANTPELFRETNGLTSFN